MDTREKAPLESYKPIGTRERASPREVLFIVVAFVVASLVVDLVVPVLLPSWGRWPSFFATMCVMTGLYYVLRWKFGKNPR